MPYSRDPRNYPPFFFDLIHAFNSSDDIQFSLPEKKMCERLRIQFYSFIRALESDITKLRKQGDIATASSRQTEAHLARTRYLEILPSLQDDTWFLTFKNRDNADHIILMKEQFQAMNIHTYDDTPFDLNEVETALGVHLDHDAPINPAGLFVDDDEDEEEKTLDNQEVTVKQPQPIEK